jgi:hypothetical protein
MSREPIDRLTLRPLQKVLMGREYVSNNPVFGPVVEGMVTLVNPLLSPGGLV